MRINPNNLFKADLCLDNEEKETLKKASHILENILVEMAKYPNYHDFALYDDNGGNIIDAIFGDGDDFEALTSIQDILFNLSINSYISIEEE